MTLGQLYEKAVQVGMANDWRGQACLDAIFAKAREDSSQPGFDEERLVNPYGDTRIAFGDRDKEVRSALVGINITPSEVVLAGVMRQMGKEVDLCLSHHVTCVNRGMYFFDDILVTHKYALAEVGVAEEEYEEAVDQWMSEVGYHWKMDTINAAKNLDIALMTIHTPCDLLHVKQTRDTFARMQDAELGQIAAELNRVEETRQTPFEEVTVHGDDSAKPGKVYNPTGAGWRPLIGLFELACQAGIDTAVLVSCDESYLDMAEKHGVNIVELPHNSNDNHGINRMLDEIEKTGPLTVYEAGDFKRVKRID